MREAFAEAMAALVSKLSPAAQLRRGEITSQLRELALQSFDVSISEARRLLGEGKHCAELLASLQLVRQQIETEDIRNVTALGVIGLVLDAGKVQDVRQHFSTEAQARKKEIEAQLEALVVEDLELMESELRRLGLETGGQEGRDYTEASCLIQPLLGQLHTCLDSDSPKGLSLLGVMLDAATTSAQEEIQNKARNN